MYLYSGLCNIEGHLERADGEGRGGGQENSRHTAPSQWGLFKIFSLKIFCSWQFGDVVQGGAWTPHVVISEESNLVHASRFRDQDLGQTVWLLVNRWRIVTVSFV